MLSSDLRYQRLSPPCPRVPFRPLAKKLRPQRIQKTLDIPKSHILQYLPYEQKNQSGSYIYKSNRNYNTQIETNNLKPEENGGTTL